MSARDWQPGDRALIEVEVEMCGLSTTLVTSSGSEFVVDTADLLPVPQADEDPRTAEERFLGATYVEDLSPTHGGLDETVEVIQPGRSEAETVTEWGWMHNRSGLTLSIRGGLTQAEARRAVERFPNERTLLSREVSPWRAARVAGTTEAGDDRG